MSKKDSLPDMSDVLFLVPHLERPCSEKLAQVYIQTGLKLLNELKNPPAREYLQEAIDRCQKC